jgi:hypothetical protein
MGQEGALKKAGHSVLICNSSWHFCPIGYQCYFINDMQALLFNDMFDIAK